MPHRCTEPSECLHDDHFPRLGDIQRRREVAERNYRDTMASLEREEQEVIRQREQKNEIKALFPEIDDFDEDTHIIVRYGGNSGGHGRSLIVFRKLKDDISTASSCRWRDRQGSRYTYQSVIDKIASHADTLVEIKVTKKWKTIYEKDNPCGS